MRISGPVYCLDMDRHKLFLQVALNKYQESYQRNRDFDIKASALMGIALASAGVLALMFANRTELQDMQALPTNVWYALLVFSAAFACVCVSGWVALRLRTWDAQPNQHELLKNVSDTSLNTIKLTHWVARSYLEADKHNRRTLRNKGRAYNSQLTALILVVATLGYIALNL